MVLGWYSFEPKVGASSRGFSCSFLLFFILSSFMKTFFQISKKFHHFIYQQCWEINFPLMSYIISSNACTFVLSNIGNANISTRCHNELLTSVWKVTGLTNLKHYVYQKLGTPSLLSRKIPSVVNSLYCLTDKLANWQTYLQSNSLADCRGDWPTVARKRSDKNTPLPTEIGTNFKICR